MRVFPKPNIVGIESPFLITLFNLIAKSNQSNHLEYLLLTPHPIKQCCRRFIIHLYCHIGTNKKYIC